MKPEQPLDPVASWLAEDSDMSPEDHERAERLLRAITIASRGRVVATHGELSDETAPVRDLSASWAGAMLRKNLDGYARSTGASGFSELAGERRSEGGQALIELLERALQHVRSSQRRLGIQPRDTLVSEVLQQESIDQVFQLTFERAATPSAVNLVVDTAFRDYILNVINNAKASLWIAVSNITDPPNARHPMSAVFDALAQSRRRGVEVLFFVPTDTNFDDGTSNTNGDKVLRRALALGARVIILHPSVPYHAKLIVVDSELVIVGNHGLTGDSLLKPGDVSLELRDEQLADEAQRWLISLAWKSVGRLVA